MKIDITDRHNQSSGPRAEYEAKPNIGETIWFVNSQGIHTEVKVLDIMHFISDVRDPKTGYTKTIATMKMFLDIDAKDL